MTHVTIVSFANERFYHALERISNEATFLPIQEKKLYKNTDLYDTDFWKVHKSFIETNARGYGYWIWKSFVTLQTLRQMNDGQILCYVDAGCTLNSNGVERFKEYISIVQQSKLGVLSFKLEDVNSQKKWTKMDLLQIHMESKDKPQLVGGIFFLRKSDFTMKLVEEWYSLCSTYHNIDDSPSILENDPSFSEHRHDQSVFSLLRYKYGCSDILMDETWPILSHLPIQATRNENFRNIVNMNVKKQSFVYYDTHYVSIFDTKTEHYSEKVSVIIPSYNRFEFLIKAIQSVKEQTYNNIEIIVVNDGSSEDEYYTYNFDNVTVIHLSTNSKTRFGFSCVGDVRNKGMEKATGEYIAFLDDDDIWLPTKVELQVQAMKETGCNMSSTNGWLGNGVYEKGAVYKFFGVSNDFPYIYDISMITTSNPIICSSVIIKRSVINSVGMFDIIPITSYEDYEYWKRILKTEKNVHVKDSLIYYDDNHGNGQLR